MLKKIKIPSKKTMYLAADNVYGGATTMLRDALYRAGYNQEEEYFYRENLRLLKRFQERTKSQTPQDRRRESEQKQKDTPVSKKAA